MSQDAEQYAKGAVESAVDKAFQFAESAWDAVADAIEKALQPGKYRFKERNAKYKAAMTSLLNQAQAAAKAGDFVTAAALAQTARKLRDRAPFKDWPQIAGAAAQLVAQADAMLQAYNEKAGIQMGQGLGGTWRAAGAIPWPLIAGGLAAAALFFRGQR